MIQDLFYWRLDTGYQISHIGGRIQDAGYRIYFTGGRIQDTG